ncbi:Di-copper centre-containing protein [Lactarius tabidus]
MLALGVLFVSLAIISVVGAPYAPQNEACTRPSVRREWRAFSNRDKAAWIQAVNCLSHVPHDPSLTPSVDPTISRIPPVNSSGSYYDDIVYIHMDLSFRIHFTGLFLPWHRWYLYSFEQALKKKCGYTGVSPYWDWTIDAPEFFKSSFWKGSESGLEGDPDFFESPFRKVSNDESGLGGWGDPNVDFSVPDGGFRTLHLSYPSPHTLRRNFTLQPFGGIPPPFSVFFPHGQKEANSSFLASEIEKVLETSPGDFKGFQTIFEGFEGAHSAVHLIMGGDLGGTCPENAPSDCTPGPAWSVNDPLFWMHHSMVDKIWYDWQNRDPKNAKSYFGGSVQYLDSLASYNQYPNGAPPFLNLSSTMPADGMFPEVTIGDVMNTTSGILCYVYE